MTTACVSQQKERAATGGAGAGAREMFLAAILHIFRQLMTPGAVRSFSHLLELLLDIDAHIVRYTFAVARRADPSFNLDPDDYALAWCPDGDFEIVHKSEIAPLTRAQTFALMRRFMLFKHFAHLRGLWRPNARDYGVVHAFKPCARLVVRSNARAPPLPS